MLLFLALLGWPASSQVVPQESPEWYFWTDDGVRHFVTERGQGDTVVVLHGGWGGDHTPMLDAVAPHTDRFRFVLYDQRGSLRSPAPPDTLSIGRFVDDLESLRQELGLERLTLLGHSKGGALGFAYLQRYPDRVRSLIAIGPPWPLPSEKRFAPIPADERSRVEAKWDEVGAWQHERMIAEIAREGLFAQRKPPRLKENLSGRERTAQARIALASANLYNIDRWRQMKGDQVHFSQSVIEAMRQNMGAAGFARWEQGHLPALTAFQGPVSVIIGDHDYLDFGGVAWPYLIDDIPNGTHTVIENAGHTIWIDRPFAFAAALRAALERAQRGA